MSSSKGKSQRSSTSKILGVIVSFISMKKNLESFDARSGIDIFVRYSKQSKSYGVYNKKTKVVKERILTAFDGNNDRIISLPSSQYLKFSRHEDDEEERVESNKATT